MAYNKKGIRIIKKKTNQNISLKIGSMMVTNLQYISQQLNAFFIENVDRTLNQIPCFSHQLLNMKY
jgi:hypothetical protein